MEGRVSFELAGHHFENPNGQPYGQATLAELNRCIRILTSADWSVRTRRLAARAPNLDVFGQSFVQRLGDVWQITDAGRAFLASIEAPVSAAALEPAVPSEVELAPPLPQPSVLMVGPKRRVRHHRRRRAADLTRRSA